MPLPELRFLSGEPSASPGADMQTVLADAASDVGNPLNALKDIVAGVGDYLADNYALIAWRLLLIVCTILLARFLLWGIAKLTRRAIDKNSEESGGSKNPRMVSSMTLLKSLARYAIYIVAVLAALQIWFPNHAVFSGVFGAFSAGAVAIGFGTQGLVKDVVSGLFLSFENQFNVGDYIRSGEHEGAVEAMALRVTYLRTLSGQQIIIPNGDIVRVVNFTRGGQQADITIPTPYGLDTRGVINVMEGALAAWARQNEDIILEPPKVLGISDYTTNSVNIRVVCNAQSMQAWGVERSMRLAIKEAFDASGIDFPFGQMDVHLGEKKGGDGGEKRRPVGEPPRPQAPHSHVEPPMWQ